MPTALRCGSCGQPARHRCSRCKAFAVCSQACMAAAWRQHKPECDQLVEARELLQQSGTSLRPGSTPCPLSAEELFRLNRRTLAVYQKHGVNVPPERGSSMDVSKKLAFFLDVLREHDSSSPANKDLSLPAKLFLNRRYNNTYRHAQETFTQAELVQLDTLMRSHHIGAAYRASTPL